jgi:hypothetical protein
MDPMHIAEKTALDCWDVKWWEAVNIRRMEPKAR